MNLFEAIEGRRSEDLATQVLLVVLESPAFRELQRLFYERVLRDGLLLCTEARRFTVATQESDRQLGRPDLKIEGEETTILLENKFSAMYTPNQLARYVEILENAAKPTSVLVLVCPGHMRTRYEKDALLQFATRGATFAAFTALQQHLATKRINLLVLSWEELLRVLDCNSFVVAELATFVRERFLRHVELTAREVQRIMSAEIPELLQKIFTLVDRVKGEFGKGGIEAGRSTQSIRYWGFYLFKDDLCFYFGYLLDPWAKYHTPLFIQASPGWKENAKLEEEHLIQSGFRKEAVDNFLVPISLAPGDEDAAVGVVVGRVQEVIDRVAAEVIATIPAENPTHQ